MPNNKVHIVVLNWNGTQDTIACLVSLKQVQYSDFQIVLVDNGSDLSNYNDLKTWSEEHFTNIVEYNRSEGEAGGNNRLEQKILSKESAENLVVIKNEENLGFAAGNNVALKYILKKENDPLALLLNNDTEVEPDFLNKLMAFMQQNGDYAAVTPQIRWFQPNTKIWNCGGKITWFGNRKYYYAGAHKNEIRSKIPFDISFITGCALLFKPQIAGILSEQFFFGEEDFEFSMRMKKENKKMACIPESIIYHKVGRSIGLKNKTTQLNRIFLFYASRFIDQKNFYGGGFRKFIKAINIIRTFGLLTMKFQISIGQAIFFLLKLWIYSEKKTRITQTDFLEIMKREY